MKLKVAVKTGCKNINISQTGITSYTVKLKSRPIDNAANIELVYLLSKYFGIPKTSITISRGLKSRIKFVEINEGEDPNEEKKKS